MSRTPLLLGLPVALAVLVGPGAAPVHAQSAAQSCDVRTGTNTSLSDAKALYARACPGVPRRDCDPLPGGAWVCSSGVVGSGAPKTTAAVSAPAPSAPPAPAPVVPAPAAPVVAPPSSSASVCSTAPAATLGAARSDYAASCSLPRLDCDPLPDGRWVCSSARIENGVVVSSPSSPQPAPSVPASPPVGGGGSAIGRFGGNDLLALHYDNCPDRDDGHALVAGRAVVDKVGISDVVVVNGTCGDGIRNRYRASSEAVVRATWGGEFLDAFRQGTTTGSPATVAAADRWAAAIASGGAVWVAEGGPSDFTARVLRRIGSLYPSVDRKRVRVVQHSTGSRGFNETRTADANLALVKSVATYVSVPNGNVGGNGSADLNERSSAFVAAARSSRYASAWNAAFAYLNPNERLDFSDTVELLYIIDDRSTRSVDDFARRYLR